MNRRQREAQQTIAIYFFIVSAIIVCVTGDLACGIFTTLGTILALRFLNQIGK